MEQNLNRAVESMISAKPDYTGEIIAIIRSPISPSVMRERLEETVHSLKLEKLLNRSLFALSGGEKQKIACASADAIHPDIFVLDEPSSNLDIATIEDLIGVIRHWQSEKKTVIVAEHRLYYLVPYADRILYMKHGSIVREFTGTEFQKLSPDELQGMVADFLPVICLRYRDSEITSSFLSEI